MLLQRIWFREFPRVEVFGQVSRSFLGEGVDAPAQVSDESSLSESGAPILNVLVAPINPLVPRDLGWDHLAVVAQEFQNALVGEDHPVRRQAHIVVAQFRETIVTTSDIIMCSLTSIALDKITIIGQRQGWLCTRDQFADPSLMGPFQKRTPLRVQRARVRSREYGTRPMSNDTTTGLKSPDRRPTHGHTITADARRDGGIDWERVRREVDE